MVRKIDDVRAEVLQYAEENPNDELAKAHAKTNVVRLVYGMSREWKTKLQKMPPEKRKMWKRLSWHVR